MSENDVRLSEDEAAEIFRGLLEQGWSVLPGGKRQARFSISISASLQERLDMLSQLFGRSRSEVVNFALVIGVSVLEDELVKAGEEGAERYE